MRREKRYISALIAMILAVLILPSFFVEVNAVSNPYPTTQDVDGNGIKEVPCTYYAWQQAYNRLGVALPAWGNAINWYQGAQNSGYSVGTTPQANSIAVWSIDTHSYGHVAFVTSVEGSQMYVNEGGRTDLTGSGGVKDGQKLPSTVGSTWYGRTLKGFIYLNGYSENPISYASITNGDYYLKHNSTGKYLAVDGGIDAEQQNISVAAYTGGKEMKLAVTKRNQGYSMKPHCTSMLVNPYGVTVSAGLNVSLFPDVNDITEWWGFEKVSGGYIVRNMGNQSCVLAVNGTNVVTASYTGASNQVWSLVPVNCSHSWGGGKVTTAATCTKAGVKTYTCSVCGATKTETIAATGVHTWDSGKVTTAATCAKKGVKTYTCSVCKGTKTETIAATGVHTWDSGKVTTAATCTKTGVKTYTCSVCKGTKTETIAATGVHTWDSGKVTTAATCVKAGVKTYTCTSCQKTKTETVAATGKHTYTSDTDTACNNCSAARAVYTLSANPKAACRGGMLILTVKIGEVENCTNFGLTVNYDPNVFSYVGGTCDISDGLMSGIGKKEDGKLNCFWAAQEGKTVSGEAFTIRLKVNDNAVEGKTTITTDKAQAAVNDNAIDAIAGTLTLDVVKLMPGDYNGNGKLTTDDAVHLLLHIMFGEEDYPIPSGMGQDVNGDGRVTTDDAVYLLLHVMFGAEDYPF